MYDVFKQLLDERGLSFYALAKELHFQPSVFSDWKAGRSIPKIDKLEKIADYFGVSLEYLRTGKNPDTTVLSAQEKRVLTYFAKLTAKDKDVIEDIIKRYSGD